MQLIDYAYDISIIEFERLPRLFEKYPPGRFDISIQYTFTL